MKVKHIYVMLIYIYIDPTRSISLPSEGQAASLLKSLFRIERQEIKLV